jgi:hypothetical protein
VIVYKAGPARGGEYRAEGKTALAAVVLIVSTTGTAGPKLTRAGLKLQLVNGGRVEHIDETSAVVPVNPVCGVNVSTVSPDTPGLGIVIVVGIALMEKVAPTAIDVADDVEPA